MPSGSPTFHEAEERLSPKTRDMHRAVVSLMEELEAIDWYQQRVDAAGDDDLRAILAHNRDEEIEHAVMTLEWIRRQSPTFDATIRGPMRLVLRRRKAKMSGMGSKAWTVTSRRVSPRNSENSPRFAPTSRTTSPSRSSTPLRR